MLPASHVRGVEVGKLHPEERGLQSVKALVIADELVASRGRASKVPQCTHARRQFPV